MNSRLSVLLIIFVSLTFSACSPGERGWCRTAAEYTPLASSHNGSRPEIGGISIAQARIETSIPADIERTTAEQLITDLLVKDLSYSGCFSSVEYGESGGSAVTVYPVLTRVAVTHENGIYKLRETALEVKLLKDGQVLLEKTYSKTWGETDAPDYEKAWENDLPATLLEIREDIVSAMSF